MLLRFEVSNHRSIFDAVDLSMIAVDEDRPSTRRFELFREQVLTTAGIYGPNASGKSNLLGALAWLSEAVAVSLRAWDDFVPREPFRFKRGPKTPSTFEVEMAVAGVRYTYRVEVDDTSVLYEALHSYPERRRRELFVREGLETTFRRGFGSVAGVRELLTPTALVLSVATRLDEPEVARFGRELAGMHAHGFGFRRRGSKQAMIGRPLRQTPTGLLFDLDPSQPRLFDPFGRDVALALLRYADLGIEDVQVVDQTEVAALGTTSARRIARQSLQLLHSADDQQLAFDFDDESAGTVTWFSLIGPTLRTLQRGRVFIFDEIDASLHPRLSARLLELFQDPETNPNNAQLIFATHDTSLLNHLNRDEVWLTEKGSDGATTLTALAEYGGEKVRRSVNLERAYLQGRFGAVPELDQYLLRQALGLVTNET